MLDQDAYLDMRTAMEFHYKMDTLMNMMDTPLNYTQLRNKWTNTDLRKYQRWDQLPGRSKHPLSTSRTPYALFQTQNQCVQISKRNNPQKKPVRLVEKICSQIPCLDHVNRTIHSKNLGNTDPWKHQRWDHVPRRRKHFLPTSHPP